MNEQNMRVQPKQRVICLRCHGMMIQDQVVRLDSRIRLELWRCVNCGDLVDSTVLQNRLAPVKVEKHYPHRRALVSQPQFIQGHRGGGMVGTE